MHVVNSASLAHVGLPPPSPRNLLRRLSGAPPTRGTKRKAAPASPQAAASAIQEDVAASWEAPSRGVGEGVPAAAQEAGPAPPDKEFSRQDRTGILFS